MIGYSICRLKETSAQLSQRSNKYVYCIDHAPGNSRNFNFRKFIFKMSVRQTKTTLKSRSQSPPGYCVLRYAWIRAHLIQYFTIYTKRCVHTYVLKFLFKIIFRLHAYNGIILRVYTFYAYAVKYITTLHTSISTGYVNINCLEIFIQNVVQALRVRRYLELKPTVYFIVLAFPANYMCIVSNIMQRILFIHSFSDVTWDKLY